MFSVSKFFGHFSVTGGIVGAVGGAVLAVSAHASFGWSAVIVVGGAIFLGFAWKALLD